MGETVVHTAEGVVDGTVAGLAGAIGATTNEVAHQAETVAAHTERLTNVDEDTRWIKERLERLEQAITEAPSTAVAELRQEMADLKHELMAQTAALSEAIVSSTTSEDPQTDPPPQQVNAAEKPKGGPIRGLRGALHRLL